MDDDTIPVNVPIITRAKAKAAGLTRYFTGKACKNGHVAERYVSTGSCKDCLRKWEGEYFDRDPVRRVHKNAHFKEWRNRPGNREHYVQMCKEWHAANPEQSREVSLKWKEANPDKVKTYSQEWYAGNIDQARAKAVSYYHANRDERIAYSHAYRVSSPEKIEAWRQTNGDKLRGQNRHRYALRRAGDGHYTADDVKRIYAMQKGKCPHCGKKLGDDYHVDHIQPVSKGGSNRASNIQLLCPPCNLKKAARDPIEHMQSLGFLL